MYASKENARKARRSLDSLVKRMNGLRVDENDAGILFLREFIDKAERKLPSEAAFRADSKRRKAKAVAS